jgi:hypothetical protein
LIEVIEGGACPPHLHLLHSIPHIMIMRIPDSPRRYIVASNILRNRVPERIKLLKTLRLFSLPLPMANASTMTSSILVVRMYLASIYQICRTNAERAAKRTSAPRPYLSGVDVEGNNKAPSDREGESRYRKTVEGDRGGCIDEAGRVGVSRCS